MNIFVEDTKKAILELDSLNQQEKEQLMEKIDSKEESFMSPRESRGNFCVIYENEEARKYMPFYDILTNFYKISNLVKTPEIIEQATILVYKMNSHYYFKILPLSDETIGRFIGEKLTSFKKNRELVSIKTADHSFLFGTTADRAISSYFFRKIIANELFNKMESTSKIIIEILQKHLNNLPLKEKIENLCINLANLKSLTNEFISPYMSNTLLDYSVILTNVLEEAINWDNHITDSNLEELEILINKIYGFPNQDSDKTTATLTSVSFKKDGQVKNIESKIINVDN